MFSSLFAWSKVKGKKEELFTQVRSQVDDWIISFGLNVAKDYPLNYPLALTSV